MIIEHKTELDKIQREFNQFLLYNSDNFKNDENTEKLKDAFNFTGEAYKDMVRYSGKPYITHSFEVAKIVVQEIGLGTKSAIAALIQDIPTKTEYNLEDIERYFGLKIRNIVEGLNKIKNGEEYENNAEASIFREILLTVSDDIRVLFVKIATKLNSLRTIKFITKIKQQKLIAEVLNIYAPLAHRLGLYDIKSEMEDICLKYTHSKIYKQIENKLESSERERLQFINRVVQPINKALKKHDIEYRIKSRSKSIFSIWKKMQNKGVAFEEVYDLFAVRIIFKKRVNEKYEALFIGSLISDIYTIKADRTRNWLEKGKDTGYMALHQTIMSNEGKWVEIQIRSENMNEAAEHGFAAHWKYKGIKEKKVAFDEKVGEILKDLSENQNPASELLDSIKLNLLTTEIYVFTPRGKIIDLPKGATALDFAFKIHTDIALKAISAKINGTLSGLDTVLTNADQIEIITSNNQTPQKIWFNQVITHKALNMLKIAFKEERKLSIDNGRLIIDELLTKNNIVEINQTIKNLSNSFDYKNKKDFFFDISEDKITVTEVIEKLNEYNPNRKTKFWKIKSPFSINTSESKKINKLLYDSYEIASCCNPTPGNIVVAIKDKNTKEIVIHKKDCPTAINKRKSGSILIPVNWTSYTAQSKLTKYTIKGSANISSLNVKTDNKEFNLDMKIYTKDDKSANKLKVNLLLQWNKKT